MLQCAGPHSIDCYESNTERCPNCDGLHATRDGRYPALNRFTIKEKTTATTGTQTAPRRRPPRPGDAGAEASPPTAEKAAEVTPSQKTAASQTTPEEERGPPAPPPRHGITTSKAAGIPPLPPSRKTAEALGRDHPGPWTTDNAATTSACGGQNAVPVLEEKDVLVG